MIGQGVSARAALVAADSINLEWKGQRSCKACSRKRMPPRSRAIRKTRGPALVEAQGVAEAAARRAPQNAHWPGFLGEIHVDLAEVAIAAHDDVAAAAEWKAARGVMEPLRENRGACRPRAGRSLDNARGEVVRWAGRDRRAADRPRSSPRISASTAARSGHTSSCWSCCSSIVVVVINVVWKNPTGARGEMREFLGLPSWILALVTAAIGAVVFWLGLKVEADWPEALGAFLIAGSVTWLEYIIGWHHFELGLVVVPYLIPILVFVVMLAIGIKKSDHVAAARGVSRSRATPPASRGRSSAARPSDRCTRTRARRRRRLASWPRAPKRPPTSRRYIKVGARRRRARRA